MTWQLKFKDTVQQVEESRKRTFMFACMDSQGHLNSLIGIANYLKRRGHRTVFVMTNKMPIPNHESYDLESQKESGQPSLEAEEKHKLMFEKFIVHLRKSAREVNKFTMEEMFPQMLEKQLEETPIVEELLDKIKPDVCIVDHLMAHPALVAQPKWVRVNSCSPLGIWNQYYTELPPEFYGLPTKAPKELIEEYRQLDHGLKMKITNRLRDFCAKKDYKNVRFKDGAINAESDFLNIYMYPQCLDYHDVCSDGLPDKWLQCDALIRRDFDNEETKIGANFKIPPSLLDKPGKLIFVSMGTLASLDVDTMKRLVSILSHSPHRFIFAKGACHDRYELNETNMWGEKFVNQLEVLQKVDLVITHGGNNTITECFYYGVPGLIVCPVFGDQADNAQRVEERCFGIKLNPYSSTKEEFLEAIEKVLADNGMKSRMKEIGKRLRHSDNLLMAATRIEELAYL